MEKHFLAWVDYFACKPRSGPVHAGQAPKTAGRGLSQHDLSALL